MKFEVAPLSGSFMLVSIFGFLFSVFFISKLPGGLPWAWAIGLVSFAMFIASVISMTRAPVEDELALDEHYKDRRKRVRFLTYKEMKAYDEKKREELRKASKPESQAMTRKSSVKTKQTSRKKANTKKRSRQSPTTRSSQRSASRKQTKNSSAKKKTVARKKRPAKKNTTRKAARR